jgi:hypothetical protein
LIFIQILTLSIYFRLFKDKADHVAVKYKFYSTDDEWMPKENDNAIELFQLDEDGCQMTPHGNLCIVPE